MTTGRAYDQAEYLRARELMRYMACHWCGQQGTENTPCVPDHEPPLAEGGSNASMVPACPTCNARRGGELVQKRNRAAGRGRGYSTPPPPATSFVATPGTTRW